MSKGNNKEVIVISNNSKSKMVVEITTHKGVKNRKGDVYKTSVTKHLPLGNKKKKGGSNAKQDGKES